MRKNYQELWLQITEMGKDVICTSGEFQETGVQWGDGTWNGNLFG